MAVKITKPGKYEFTGHCDGCGCEFTYGSEDVGLRGSIAKVVGIDCPHCGRALIHHGEHGTSPSAPAVKEEDKP